MVENEKIKRMTEVGPRVKKEARLLVSFDYVFYTPFNLVIEESKEGQTGR